MSTSSVLVVDPDPTDYLLRNRRAWDEMAKDYADAGRRNFAAEAGWGIWGVPESEIQLLPESPSGMTVL